MQSGLRLRDLFLENALTFAATLTGVVASTFTAANFPATPVKRLPGLFGLSDAAAAFAAIPKGRAKNLILDSAYFAPIAHTPGFQTGAPQFGWRGIFEQSAGWASAGPNVRGLACAENAIVCVTGFLFPLRTRLVKQMFLALPGLEIPIEFNQWIDTSSRTYWASFDGVLGASAADGSAGCLIQSQ